VNPETPKALELLLRIADLLEEIGVRYHVGGSMASSVHGIPRQTRDIDLVVNLDDAMADALVNRLADKFFVRRDAAHAAVSVHGCFNAIHLDSGLKIDFFVLGADPFDAEEFQRGQPQIVQVDPERRVFVKSAEDTILRKLQWYRSGGEISDQQWGDAVGIARTVGPSLDREYLRRWAGHLEVADLLDRALTPPGAV
jgi:hypothetical protein